MEVAALALGGASLYIQICQALLAYCAEWKVCYSDIDEIQTATGELKMTLELLSALLTDGMLGNTETTFVVKCLSSCSISVTKLNDEAESLRQFVQPRGLTQELHSNLQRLNYPLINDTLKKLRQTVHEDLSHTPIGVSSEVCEARTGAWLFRSSAYANWKSGLTKHLWLVGKAGCGKTVLFSTAVEDMNTYCVERQQTAVAYFYFKASKSGNQNANDLFRSILAQLGRKEPGLSILQQACDKSDHNSLDINGLERLLNACVNAYDIVFVMLDALDESSEECDARFSLLDCLGRLAHDAPKVKIFATSREVCDVSDAMEDLEAHKLSMVSSEVNADIQTYVSAQLQQHRRFQRLDWATKVLIEEKITEKADGMRVDSKSLMMSMLLMFVIGASCQLFELKKLKSAKRRHIEDVLNALPTTLEQTSPLTLAQLAETTIVDPIPNAKADTENRGNWRDTLDILSGLVTTVSDDIVERDHGNEATLIIADTSDDVTLCDHRIEPARSRSRIRLIHFSVRDYHESSHILDGDAKHFHLESASGQRFLAQSCLMYLLYYNESNTRTSTSLDLVKFPLLEYAAKSWFHHSVQDPCDDISREISLLSSEKARENWLRVFNPEWPRREAFASTATSGSESTGSDLYFACLLGLDKVARTLLEPRAVHDAVAERNHEAEGRYHSALQAASLVGRETIVMMLLSARADVNAQGGEYGNALQAASSKGHTKVVQMLLNHGADVNAQGGYFDNALHAAHRKSHVEVAELLISHGAHIDAQGADDEQIEQKLGKHAAREGVSRAKYCTALQAVALNGHKAVVETLLSEGARLDARPGQYGTALEAALLNGHTDKVAVRAIPTGSGRVNVRTPPGELAASRYLGQFSLPDLASGAFAWRETFAENDSQVRNVDFGETMTQRKYSVNV
nr:ankyrin repeat and sam domain-containing protein 6 [Quercus suber]